VRFSDNIARMWVGFFIPILCFVLVKIDQCFGEPEPVITDALSAVSSILGITSSISSLLSSAGHMTSSGYKEGIFIRQKDGGCLDAEMESYNCWNPTLSLTGYKGFVVTIQFRSDVPNIETNFGEPQLKTRFQNVVAVLWI
jgi:hypothetical protein